MSQSRKSSSAVSQLLNGFMAKQRATGAATQASTGGGLASMLDFDGDGNPLDDILKMAGKAFR